MAGRVLFDSVDGPDLMPPPLPRSLEPGSLFDMQLTTTLDFFSFLLFLIHPKHYWHHKATRCWVNVSLTYPSKRKAVPS